MSVTELSMSRSRRDLYFLRGLYKHPRLRNRMTRWRMKQQRVRERRALRAKFAEVRNKMVARRAISKAPA